MISWFLLVLRALTGMARSHASLAAENAVLRHQLSVLQRDRKRPLLQRSDRVLWIWLCRHWSRWRCVLVLIQPATVVGDEYHIRVARRARGGCQRVVGEV